MLRSRLMNQMILLAALASLVGAFPALARVGEVQTREGKYHEGQVRFTREGLVVINASLDSVTPVGLTNLAGVIFQTNDAFTAWRLPTNQSKPCPRSGRRPTLAR